MPVVRVCCWNVDDLFYDSHRGKVTSKKALVATHARRGRCSHICVQEAWVTSKWPTYDTDWRFPMGNGLAAWPRHGWQHKAFSCAAGEDACVHKGFAWCDTRDCVLYNVHLQSDNAVGWGDAREIRRAQMNELREHMMTHGDRPVVAVGDFNHPVMPLEDEIADVATNQLDGVLARNVQGDVYIDYPAKESTELSDHPLMVISVQW